MSKKDADYNQKSEEIKKLCDNDVALEAARKAIFEDLVGSVAIIKQQRNAESSADSIRACKEHLTLAGLYNLPQTINVKNFVPLDLTESVEVE